MKKLLVWGMSPNLGGIETYLLNFLNNCPDNLQIDFTCPYSNLYFSQEIANRENSSIKYICSKKTHPIKVVIDMIKLLKDNYNIVYFNICGPSISFLLILIISKLFNVKKIIVHCHANQGFHISEYSIFRVLMKLCATDIWSCSNEAAVWLFGKKLMKKKNYLMINNSINSSLFKFNLIDREKIKLELGISKKIVIGTVGRLSNVKNQIFLINGLSHILKNNLIVHLVIIGSGELENDLKNRVKELSLDHHVTFLEAKKDIYRYYNIFDYFCLPSLNEGFPMTLLEAQANGLKCIVSNNITREVNITNLVDYIDISDANLLYDYLSKIEPTSLSKREQYNNLIKKSNYDISHNISNILKQMEVS